MSVRTEFMNKFATIQTYMNSQFINVSICMHKTKSLWKLHFLGNLYDVSEFEII